MRYGSPSPMFELIISNLKIFLKLMNSKLILNIVVCFDDFYIIYTPPLIIPLLPPSSSLKGKSHWISTESHWDDGIQLVNDFEFTDQSHWPKKSMTFHTFVTKYTKVNDFRSMTLISAAPSKRAIYLIFYSESIFKSNGYYFCGHYWKKINFTEF